jgi:hypothetical protein
MAAFLVACLVTGCGQGESTPSSGKKDWAADHPQASGVQPPVRPPSTSAAPRGEVPPGRDIVPPADRGYVYIHDTVPRVPWSIHVVKASRRQPGLELDTTMGQGAAQGVSVVSRQMALVPAESGRPVAAINGDYFGDAYLYFGDPAGLQIARGELISAPHPTRVCFWMDARGELHRTNVQSLFQVTWPDGTQTPMQLNEDRPVAGATLYTRAVGESTRTKRGLDVELIGEGNTPLAPLKPGKTYRAVIKALNENGNSPLASGVMVISAGPKLASRLSKLRVGASVLLSTATQPDLSGARTALGGGPTLVHNAKLWHWSSLMPFRHPRTAFGWNKDYFFLVEVDGRQMASAGMTFEELADYLVRLGCEEAINLDGGGSATLWVDGRVVNKPCQGRERPSCNSIMLIQRPGVRISGNSTKP